MKKLFILFSHLTIGISGQIVLIQFIFSKIDKNEQKIVKLLSETTLLIWMLAEIIPCRLTGKKIQKN